MLSHGAKALLLVPVVLLLPSKESYCAQQLIAQTGTVQKSTVQKRLTNNVAALWSVCIVYQARTQIVSALYVEPTQASSWSGFGVNTALLDAGTRAPHRAERMQSCTRVRRQWAALDPEAARAAQTPPHSADPKSAMPILLREPLAHA